MYKESWIIKAPYIFQFINNLQFTEKFSISIFGHFLVTNTIFRDC